jgi:NAD(P) transhydrogenase subunit beta
MLLAVIVTLLDQDIVGYGLIAAGLLAGALVGTVLALKIKMTAMPQLVGLFNGFGGGASILVAGAVLMDMLLLTGQGQGASPAVTASGAAGGGSQFTIAAAASGLIGAVTFWGSLVARR